LLDILLNAPFIPKIPAEESEVQALSYYENTVISS